MTPEEEFKLRCQHDQLILLIKSIKERISNPVGIRDRLFITSMIDFALKECEEDKK